MQICIFEDAKYKDFLPLVYFRPVCHLHCGAFSLRERTERLFPGVQTVFQMRDELAEIMSEHYSSLIVNSMPAEDTWFINGRVLSDENLVKLVRTNSRVQKVYIQGDNLAAAYIKRENLSQFAGSFSNRSVDELSNIPAEIFSGTIVHYPWDLVNHTAEEIERDFSRLKIKNKIAGKIYRGSHLINKKNIIIGRGSAIKPGAVLDAERGAIIIGKNVVVMPNAVIEGPVFIGDNSTIKIGAKIYHGTSIGKWCKVGGEVEASIIQSYSNKQHEGFLGHSYLASWVNLGADTNTSDLKNNYSAVRVQINGRMIDSGNQFVGLTMGDHSKSGINVMFDTGTVVGISGNIYGAGLPPKFVPSFAWGSEKDFTIYDLDRSLDTMRKVMARRSVKMTPGYEKLVRKIYADTADERQSSGVK